MPAGPLQGWLQMTYPEFWRRYLAAHTDPRTRGLHYFGTLLGVALLVAGERFSYARHVRVGTARQGATQRRRQREERKVTMMRLIEYGEASAEVRAVYDDIMTRRRK